jgi:hypothetical protein
MSRRRCPECRCDLPQLTADDFLDLPALERERVLELMGASTGETASPADERAQNLERIAQVKGAFQLDPDGRLRFCGPVPKLSP